MFLDTLALQSEIELSPSPQWTQLSQGGLKYIKNEDEFYIFLIYLLEQSKTLYQQTYPSDLINPSHRLLSNLVGLIY